MKRLTLVLASFVVVACALTQFTASAHTYPAKPVRMVVPYPPGGAIDVLGRGVAQKLGVAFGQPFVLENRGGANGAIGAEMVARSVPDGYTVLLGNVNSQLLTPLLMKNPPYDPFKDFAPITAAIDPTTCMVVNPSLPVNSVKELIEYARRNPGKLSYGTNGIGSMANLHGEFLKDVANIDILHVPYKGGAQSLAATVTGEVQMLFNPLGAALPQIRSGKVRILAVTKFERYPGLPEVPTLLEATGVPSLPNWYGFFGPAALPQPIVARLNSEIVRALKAPELRAVLDNEAMTVIGNTPEQFAAMIREGDKLFRRAVQAAKLTPQ
jgi:tripartite-type tricarboxylate transporter receptor subunit TctC